MFKSKELLILFLTSILILSGGLFFYPEKSAAGGVCLGCTYLPFLISQNTTLTSSQNPYFINTGTEVAANVTLTIEPGVIIKFGPRYQWGWGTWPANLEFRSGAKIIAHGTQANPIIFTSWADDEIGGDTNGDGDATTPTSANNQWGHLLLNTSAGSFLENLIFRYGGSDKGALALVNSQAGVSQTLFKKNQTALYLAGSSNLEIISSQFKANHTGVFFPSGQANFSQNQFLENFLALTTGQEAIGNFVNNHFAFNTYLIQANPNTFLNLANNTAENNLYPYIELIATPLIKTTTWQSDFPYVLKRDLTIQSGILTLEPGTVIKFGPHYQSGWYTWPVNFLVNSQLIAQGTPDQPIVFTSICDNDYGGQTSDCNPQSGSNQWGVLKISNQPNLVWQNVVIRYSSTNGALTLYQSQALFDNLTLDSNFIGLNLSQSKATTTNSLIKNHYSGIAISDSQSALKIENSDFQNNSHYAIFNGGTNNVLAQNNFWGDDSGPYHPTLNPQGLGNRITDHVLFDPWLGKTPDPVIIVPGIMGSWQTANIWTLDPILHTYDNLIEAMIKYGGYELDKNLFTFPYDWRQNNVNAATLLKQKIAVVKQITGKSKVDLVVHSMGGLVARSYIQSADYQNDIDQMIFIATPHLGAPESYLTYEGAYMPGFIGGIMKSFFRFEALSHGYLSLTKYIQEQVPSVSQLLPTNNYLQDKVGDIWIDRLYPIMYPRNGFLENLNVTTGINLLKQRTRITNIISNMPNSTLTKIKVLPDPNIYDNNWKDGYPLNLDSNREGLITGDGDGTVPYSSANFLSGVDLIEFSNSTHRQLVSDSQQDVIEILGNRRPTDIVSSPWGIIRRIILVRVYSPVNLLITTPDNKKIGFDYQNNTTTSEIEGAFYDPNLEFITIPNPIDGEYKIETIGIGTGSYGLSVAYLDDQTDIERFLEASTTLNQIDGYLVNYDSTNPEEPLGNLEPEDQDPPVITIISPEAKNYLHSEIVPVDISIVDEKSGVATSSIILDGQIFDNSSIDSFFLNLGTHNFTVNAQDNKNNATSTTITFNIIATFDSLIADISRSYNLGWIKNYGTTNSLIQQVENAEKWYNKDKDKKNAFKSFINKLSTLSSDLIFNQAKEILFQQVEYLINNL